MNLDQVKSYFYFAVTYYQKAYQYVYTPPPAPIPATYIPMAAGDDPTKSQYKLGGNVYPGKICLDFGYNTEDLLLTFKAALGWRDCYKNLIYTFTDLSNWLGPKAMWVDFCDYSTSEDLLIYSYNPFDIRADTGDRSIFWFVDRVAKRTVPAPPIPPPTQSRRPSPG